MKKEPAQPGRRAEKRNPPANESSLARVELRKSMVWDSSFFMQI